MPRYAIRCGGRIYHLMRTYFHVLLYPLLPPNFERTVPPLVYLALHILPIDGLLDYYLGI